jgi:hypothetical protein
MSARLLGVLERAGYSYDSSILPSVPYYISRAAAIGMLALLGRRSASMTGNAMSCLAPSAPYCPSPAAFWRRGSASLVELPLTITPVGGVPFIGTFITAAPLRIVLRTLRGLSARPFLNIGIHGLDLLDVTDGVPRALLGRQPGLGVPAAEKMRRLVATLTRLKETHSLITLAGAAEAYRRSGPAGEAP